jgi:ATP-binding cassette, subfamily B, bacterial
MGFFGGLNAENMTGSIPIGNYCGGSAQYFKPQLWRLVGNCRNSAVDFGAGALQPVIVSRGIDIMAEPTLFNITLISVAVLLVGSLGWTSNYARRRLTIRAIGRCSAGLGTDAFRAAAEHDLSFYDEYSSGRIQSRITSDTREFRQPGCADHRPGIAGGGIGYYRDYPGEYRAAAGDVPVWHDPGDLPAGD